MSDPSIGDAKSIVHYISPTLTQAQRDLLMSDYAMKRPLVPSEERRPLDDTAFSRHSTNPPESEKAYSVAGGDTSQDGDTARKIDLAILTVLPVELRAVRSVFEVGDAFDRDADGRRYYSTKVASCRLKRDFEVKITLAEGAYDVNAAEAVHKLLLRWEPQILFLVGIGAGNSAKLSYADVVVPRIVTNHDAARSEPDREVPRPRPEPIPWEVGNNLNYYDAGQTGFNKRIREYCRSLRSSDRPSDFKVRQFLPKVESQNATSGVTSKLIADGTTMDELRSRDQHLILVDQESYGFARACRGRWWAVFRGISDFGDPEKDSEWHFLAASTAALALRDFLENEYLPPEDRD